VQIFGTPISCDAILASIGRKGCTAIIEGDAGRTSHLLLTLQVEERAENAARVQLGSTLVTPVYEGIAVIVAILLWATDTFSVHINILPVVEF
jgi:hypothetical protein